MPSQKSIQVAILNTTRYRNSYPLNGSDHIDNSVVFEFLVQEVLDLVDTAEISTFDAVDRVTSRYQYEEFEALLEEVRTRIENERGHK